MKKTGKAFGLAAGAGLAAVVAVAGCSQPGKTTQAAQQTKRTVVTAAPAKPAVTAGPPRRHATGHAAFQAWWQGSGYTHYDRVAKDLEQIIILDVVQYKDANFVSDSHRLTADAVAAEQDPPPSYAAAYLAAMRAFARGGQHSAAGSYGKAYAAVRYGLQKMQAFNEAAGITASSVPSASR